MKPWRFAPLAEKDLEGICRCTTQQWSPAQADRYISDVFNTVEGVASGELLGKTVDDRDGYLKHRSGSHMVYFRLKGEAVIVVRSLHQCIDAQRHL